MTTLPWPELRDTFATLIDCAQAIGDLELERAAWRAFERICRARARQAQKMLEA